MTESTQAQITGALPLTQDMIDQGETIYLMEGSKSLEFTTTLGDSLEKVRNKLNHAIEEAGLQLDVYFDPMGKMTITHKDYGSEHTFSAISSTAGVLSEKADTRNWQSLPYEIHYIRIPVPGGTSQVKVRLTSPVRNQVYIQNMDVSVKPGETKFYLLNTVDSLPLQK